MQVDQGDPAGVPLPIEDYAYDGEGNRTASHLTLKKTLNELASGKLKAMRAIVIRMLFYTLLESPIQSADSFLRAPFLIPRRVLTAFTMLSRIISVHHFTPPPSRIDISPASVTQVDPGLRRVEFV